MEPRAITISAADRGWHEAFLKFVPRVFPRISFRRWWEFGGWDERYIVFALVEGERIVASASLTRMDLLLNEQPVRGWQLGTVGTLPDHRGRGLQNRILPRLLDHTGPDDLVFLFANHQVLDFYPRYGFARATERLFEDTHAVDPAGPPLRALDIGKPDDRALLQRVAAAALPVTTAFGARDYGTIVLWHWANFFRRGLRYVPEADAIVVVEQRDDVLHVYDVLCARPLELASLLPRLVRAPVHRLEFGFTATRIWPSAEPKPNHTDSSLFIRGRHSLPAEPLKFPMLAQT